MKTRTLASTLRIVALAVFGGSLSVGCIAASTGEGDGEKQADSDDGALIPVGDEGGGGQSNPSELKCSGDNQHFASCVNDVAVWCDGNGNFYSEDCGAGGRRCDWDQNYGEYACTGEPGGVSCNAPIGCAIPTYNENLGVVAGDEGADHIGYDGFGSKALFVRLSENSWSSRSIRGRFLLTNKDSTNYDLWVQKYTYDGMICDRWTVYSSDAKGPGPIEEFSYEESDHSFVPDNVDLWVWVVPRADAGCSSWHLDIYGNP